MTTLTEGELEKLKKKTRDLLSLDRQRLLVRFPFTGGFIMRLDIIPVRDMRLRTAATDGQRIFFDIAFCAKLTSEERLFVLAHEAWHCILMHMLRLQTREAGRFNLATDMEVNYLLGKEGLAVPKFCLYPEPKLEGKSAEEIYETLRGRKGNEKAGGGGERSDMVARTSARRSSILPNMPRLSRRASSTLRTDVAPRPNDRRNIPFYGF